MLAARLYSIGEMCGDFAVTARALRFYEDELLISPERRGTQRLYSERDRARLAWILRGKRVGFSLSDIREMLDLYDVGDHRETQRLVTLDRCRNRIDSLHAQRGDIDATIAELHDFIATLDPASPAQKPKSSAPKSSAPISPGKE